jgi:hypothetical protein
LLATGAVFAAGSAVGLTLVEVLTTPDRERATVDPTTDQFNSIVGFVAAAAASVGAVAMVTGAGLAISDP